LDKGQRFVIQDTLGRSLKCLEQGGRLLGWLGETIPVGDVKIGMEVQAVPRILEDTEEIKLYFTIEQPGTTWGKAPEA